MSSYCCNSNLLYRIIMSCFFDFEVSQMNLCPSSSLLLSVPLSNVHCSFSEFNFCALCGSFLLLMICAYVLSISLVGNRLLDIFHQASY